MRITFRITVIFISLLSAVSLKLHSASIRWKHCQRFLASCAMVGCCILNAGTAIASDAASDAKLRNISVKEAENIIADDINKRQALITADFTRGLYSEDCRFQDEIDTYPIDQYIKGTKALFDPSASHVDLTSTVTHDDADGIYKFTFSEVLAFNVPFKPKVSLTGRVELRQGSDGLITYSREYWDKSVPEVLKGIYF